MTQPKQKILLSTALITLAIGRAFAADVTATAPSAEQSASERRQITVAIPAQRLAESLRQLAEISGLQLVYDAKIVEGKTSPGVAGTMTSRAAIGSLLAGSGLSFRFSGDRSVIVTPSAGGAARSVGVVSVTGVGNAMPFGEMASPVNGVNGSRDVEATEGTGSYTTGATSIVSKIPLALRDLSQSVSVMTQQQIKDQNLISARDILEKMAGVTVAQGGTGEEFDINSRGFAVTSISFDGGAADQFTYNNRPVLNMAEFDSVQLIRGAGGLFGGYGDPGGVINLVRKKPLDHNQFTYEQNIGSWQNFREVVDVTGPLSADKKLRGRAVYSQQDNKFFYDGADAHKKALYGVLEYDLSPRTLFTAGGSYNHEKNKPNVGGLPRYANGDAIDWPISTCFCLPFSRDNATKTELFASLNHEFNDDLSTKLNYTYTDQLVDASYYGAEATVFRPGAGTTRASFTGTYSHNPLKQHALDVVTSGRFMLAGREQSLVVGGNVQLQDNSGGNTTFVRNVRIPDIFNFNPGDYAEPVLGLPDYVASKSKATKYGAYANLRLAPMDDLHVTVGMRYSALKENIEFSYPTTPDSVPEVFPALRDKSRSKPNFGFTYDFLKDFTAYGSYQAIYQPQTSTRYVSASFVPPPITGVNQELGLKWERSDKKLNASLAVYRITQKGFLVPDYSSTPTASGYATQYATSALSNYKSEGADVEVAGELMPGLQASISYSYNKNSQEVSYASGSTPKNSYNPKNILKTWFMYRGAEDGPLGRVSLGGGINVQSKAYTTGGICTATNAEGGCVAYGEYDFNNPGYATLSAKVGYLVNKNVDVSVKFDNITNVKRYLATGYQGAGNYNFYLQPFSVLAALNAKF